MTTPMKTENRFNAVPLGSGEDSLIPGQRKKLQLKPRTVPDPMAVVRSSPLGNNNSSNSPNTTKMNSNGMSMPQSKSPVHSSKNPFGAAIPREQVLQRRGIDPALQDSRFEKKAELLHYTAEQEAALERVRAQLTHHERELRHANERELPEETFRVAVEAKRVELNALLKRFADENAKTKQPHHYNNNNSNTNNNNNNPHDKIHSLDRPGGATTTTERRTPRVMEPPHHPRSPTGGGAGRARRSIGDADEGDAAFTNFSSNRRRRRPLHPDDYDEEHDLDDSDYHYY